MNYETAKKNKNKAVENYEQAKADFEQAKENLQSSKTDIEQKYEALTQAMAEHDAGDATTKDVKKAKTAHTKAKNAAEDAKVNVDVKAKSVNILETKKKEAVRQYKNTALGHFQKKAEKHLSTIHSSMVDIENELAGLTDIRNEMKVNNLSPVGKLRDLGRHPEVVISKRRLAGPRTMNFIQTSKLNPENNE